MQSGDVMTVREVAEYLHCHVSTIYRLVKVGGIPAFKVSDDWQFLTAEIDRWSRERTIKVK